MNHTPYTDPIATGQHVHCTLYGGTDGIVVDIHGAQQPQSVRTFGGVGVTGGNAYLDVIWNNGSQSRKLPEALVRASVQWRVKPQVATADEIESARKSVIAYQAAAAADQALKDAAYAREREEAIAAYPNLIRVQQGDWNVGKHAAKNIRLELKAAFPKHKFSVKSDYSSIDIRWTDGPTAAQVDAITNRYCNGGFDGMTDMEYSSPSAFTNLFGGAKFISCCREASDELLAKALDALYVRLAKNLEDIPKPDLATALSGYIPIPHLDRLTVAEATRYIASCWDCLGQSFHVGSRFSHNQWLVWSDKQFACPALS